MNFDLMPGTSSTGTEVTSSGTELHAVKPIVQMTCSCVDEIRFRLLLNKCKQKLIDRTSNDLWRVDQYVQYLTELLKILKLKHSGKMSNDLLIQYEKDVNFLQDMINSEKKETTDEKLTATSGIVVPRHISTATSAVLSDDLSLGNVKLQKTVQFAQDLRRELLGEDEEDFNTKNSDISSGLRLRRQGDVLETNNTDIDAVLKHHHQVQEQLSEQFLEMTMHLKHNITAAGQVVRDDNKTLEKSHATAAKNYAHLHRENSRLQHFIEASCEWWPYLMLLIVWIVFIGMVIFMKLFHKKY